MIISKYLFIWNEINRKTSCTEPARSILSFRITKMYFMPEEWDIMVTKPMYMYHGMRSIAFPFPHSIIHVTFFSPLPFYTPFLYPPPPLILNTSFSFLISTLSLIFLFYISFTLYFFHSFSLFFSFSSIFSLPLFISSFSLSQPAKPLFLSQPSMLLFLFILILTFNMPSFPFFLTFFSRACLAGNGEA